MRVTNVLVPVDLFKMTLDFISDVLEDAGSDPSEDETFMRLKNILTTAEGVFND
jgi:hypothetical protein